MSGAGGGAGSVLDAAIGDALARIRAWGEACEWRGYDPYDALNSPAAGWLSLGRPLGRRVLTQAVKLSPVNLRPLLGVSRAWNAKALGLVASGYARLWGADGDPGARAQARRWHRQLADMDRGGPDGSAWGYHFPVQTRVFAYPRETPNTIATAFVAQALLDGYELMGEQDCLDTAFAAARFLQRRMLVTAPRTYFRYLPDEGELVHNANALACAVLARAGRLGARPDLIDAAGDALAVTVAAQRPDGSWPYAEGEGLDWVDNFHTAYVLGALAECARSLPGLQEALRRGMDHWEAALFAPDGTPKYFVDRTLPVDAHCYATAIDTWVGAHHHRPEGLARAHRTARRLVAEMLDPSGFVWFQRRRLWTSRVPFIRWTTAPTFQALAGLRLHARLD